MTALVQSAAASFNIRDRGAFVDRAANFIGAVVLAPGLLLGAGMFVMQSL